VDLPEPVGPTRNTNSPLSTDSDTFASAVRSPEYITDTFWSSINWAVPRAPVAADAQKRWSLPGPPQRGLRTAWPARAY
jgi:hypothetical protein